MQCFSCLVCLHVCGKGSVHPASQSINHASRSVMGAGHWHLHPRMLAEVQTPVQQLRWLLYRVGRSEVSTGPEPGEHLEDMFALLEHTGREQVQGCTCQGVCTGGPQSISRSYLPCSQQSGCERCHWETDSLEGFLTSVMRQDYVLGCKVEVVVSSKGDSSFTYLGKSVKPQQQLTCKQLAQCQFPKLVMGRDRVDSHLFLNGQQQNLRRGDAFPRLPVQRCSTCR